MGRAVALALSSILATVQHLPPTTGPVPGTFDIRVCRASEKCAEGEGTAYTIVLTVEPMPWARVPRRAMIEFTWGDPQRLRDGNACVIEAGLAARIAFVSHWEPAQEGGLVEVELLRAADGRASVVVSIRGEVVEGYTDGSESGREVPREKVVGRRVGLPDVGLCLRKLWDRFPEPSK